MPLKKILFRPGVNRENTRYASESLGSVSTGTQSVGGWYESDKIRFRAGTPEKIGGWAPISTAVFQGICRSIWNWVTLSGWNLLGLGTNLKFYLERGGTYYDITPIRTTTLLPNNPFSVSGPASSTTVTVNAPLHGAGNNDFVTFSGVTGTYATVLNKEFQITYVNANTYTITTASAVAAGATGGAAVSAAYQINTGATIEVPLTGWGSGLWGSGVWGSGSATSQLIRLWSQSNFGEDLVFGPRGGAIYYWDATTDVTSRAVAVTSLAGASDVPTVQNFIFISDTSRFVFAFGCNDYGSSTQDPMLIRWSDQESVTQWTPAATNQAGSVRLSHGSTIVTAVQTRQEIVVLTDSSVYSLQYLGPPAIWSSQILGDNISIVGQNAAVIASGKVYWMGVDKFYVYDGRVQTLRCDLRQYVYGDINLAQSQQFFAGTSEGFNEVWWFYCSQSGPDGTGTTANPNTTVDRYVVYNYLEDVWYYGTMGRTAWLDSGLREYPVAATYANTIVNHEYGVDDNTTGTAVAIDSYISSSEFDIDDGHNFGFVYRILPDLTFRGSTGTNTPQVTMTLIPLANSGSGYNDPQSEGGSSYATIQRTKTYPVEEFTGQVFVRVRGRQMVFKVENAQLGTQWQLGAPRIDIRADGRRGG